MSISLLKVIKYLHDQLAKAANLIAQDNIATGSNLPAQDNKGMNKIW